MQFSLPSFDTVVEIHEIMLESYGGFEGVPHPDFIESALARPQNYMAYSEGCDIHLVCAALLDALARDHAFADGNKRTALVTMLMTYRLNKVRISYGHQTNMDLENLVLKIADDKNKKFSVNKVRAELKKIIDDIGEEP